MEPSPWRRRLRTTVKWGLLGFCGAVLLGIAGFAIAYATVPLPNPDPLAQQTQIFIRDGDGYTQLGAFGTNRTNVSLSKVPKPVQDAVLAAENRDFRTDKGISPKGIARALINNAKGGSTQGGSTITQQYVKNTYTESERSYKRKAKEFLFAIKVDRQLSKNQILENYLNTIYWGNGVDGIQAASQGYFHEDVDQLDVAQGIFLAGIIRSPGRYNPAVDRTAAVQRWEFVRDAMVNAGTLDAAAAQKLKFPKVYDPKPKSGLSGPNGYLLDVVRSELNAKGYDDREIDTGGLRVYTTFDKKKQAAAVAAMKEQLDRLKERSPEKSKDVHAGLAAVEPGTGAVYAMYGGADYPTRTFNDATQARKQAGSTFKVFTLAAMLREGYNIQDREWQGNAPLTVPDIQNGKEVTTKVFNSSGDGASDKNGKVNLLTALEDSINTAFVDATMRIGPDKVVQAINDAGLSAGKGRQKVDQLTDVPSITLGTTGVSPVDLADAYATFAAGGKQTPWYVVQQVVGRGPKPHNYNARPRPVQAFDPEIAQNVSYAMSQVAQHGTGTVAEGADRPVAVKTGTHSNGQDKTVSAWFAGFTPQMATAVNFYREGTKGDRSFEEDLNGVGGEAKFHGNSYPGRVWTAFTRSALEGEDKEPIANPTEENATPVQQPSVEPSGDGQTGEPSVDPSGSSSPTASPGSTPTDTGTGTPSATPSATGSPTASATGTPTPSPTCTRRNPRFCPPDGPQIVPQ